MIHAGHDAWRAADSCRVGYGEITEIINMSRLNFWLMAAILLAACGGPTATRTAIAPTATSLFPQFPPTWTPTPRRGTLGPSLTPAPTRTPAPIMTPAASQTYTSTDEVFTLDVPSNWSAQSGERQMVGQQTQQMKYVAFGSPGAAPQPAVIIFYGWPAASINSDNAWQAAFAVASLAIKVCPMTLSVGSSIEIGGEPGKYIGYEDKLRCARRVDRLRAQRCQLRHIDRSAAGRVGGVARAAARFDQFVEV